MSRPFHEFNATPAMQNEILTGAQGIRLASINSMPTQIRMPRINDSGNNDGFKTLLGNVMSRFNLDQSEAARRIFVDLFITQSLFAVGTNVHGIVTTEYPIPENDHFLGHGRFDYVLSSIADSNEEPDLTDCIVIEAKKDLTTRANDVLGNAKYQVVAELITILQLLEWGSWPGFLRGIATDGRNWNFIELGVDPGNSITIYSSGQLDVLNANGSLGANVDVVQRTLAYWFTNYSIKNASLLSRIA